jgi:molybdopterin synthase catalytic subunit
MTIQLTHQPIDPADVLRQVSAADAGATVLFVGTTRRWTGPRRTEFLVYESYRAMAEEQLAQLAAAAQRQWNLLGVLVVHRLGRVDVGEASVAIAVSAAHRAEAFEAGKWLIDRIKETVPIWKQEHWENGTSQWVHPRRSDTEDHERPPQ